MSVELAEVRDFLALHHPFSELTPDALDALPKSLTARYYRRGSTLVGVGQRNDNMVIVRSGGIDLTDAHGALVERDGEGACIGLSSVMSGGPSAYSMTAVEDTLVLLLPGPVFHQLLNSQPPFASFFMRRQAGRIRSAVQAVGVEDSGSAILRTRVSDIAKRAPITIAPTASIRDAAVAMSDARVSAILVTEPGRLAGILTDRDLRRVVAEQLDASASVSTVMTPDPSTVTGDALAFEVLMGMTQRRIHHLPVVDADGACVGIVTAGDLMRLEQSNPVFLVGDIAKQSTLEGIAASARRLPNVVETLISQDMPADDVQRVVTAVGDAVVRRLLNLAESELGTPPVHYCWVALGSQARLEQGVNSDQDSAILLSDDARPEHDAYFAALASRVVDGLEACGFPRCPGDMMASNPRWRLRLTDWAHQFATWINSPDPEALLHTQTFFDMRPLYGDNALHATLATAVTAAAPTSPRFLQQLATQAQAWKVPLGFFRDFAVSDSGDHRNTLDLKAGGIAALVQMARLFALARGISAVGTAARFKAASAAGGLSAENADNLVEAFEFIQHVKLAHQARQIRAGQEPDNHVNPAELTGLEKRQLRDAFEIVRKMQGALGHVYQTQLTS